MGAPEDDDEGREKEMEGEVDEDNEACLAMAWISGWLWLVEVVVGEATKALRCNENGPTACNGNAWRGK